MAINSFMNISSCSLFKAQQFLLVFTRTGAIRKVGARGVLQKQIDQRNASDARCVCQRAQTARKREVDRIYNIILKL